MYVKHLFGPRLGEIEDLPFEVAKMKVEKGEALDVYGQIHSIPAVTQPPVVSTRIDEVALVGAHKQKGNRKR